MRDDYGSVRYCKWTIVCDESSYLQQWSPSGGMGMQKRECAVLPAASSTLETCISYPSINESCSIWRCYNMCYNRTGRNSDCELSLPHSSHDPHHCCIVGSSSLLSGCHASNLLFTKQDKFLQNRVCGCVIQLTMYLMILDSMPVASPSSREVPLCKLLASTSCKELRTTNNTCSDVYRQQQFGKTKPRLRGYLVHGMKVSITSGRPIALFVSHTAPHTRITQLAVNGKPEVAYAKARHTGNHRDRQPSRQRHVKLQNPYCNRVRITTDRRQQQGGRLAER